MAMSSKDNYIVKVGRDSRTGEFIPVREAQRRPDTTEVERIKVPPTTRRRSSIRRLWGRRQSSS
jgi:hypothetical protein